MHVPAGLQLPCFMSTSGSLRTELKHIVLACHEVLAWASGPMAESNSKYIHSDRYGHHVFSRKGGKTWTGQMPCNGKKMHIGTHPTEDLAAHAYSK